MRRENKTGSIYQRASDGRWFGSVTAGYTESGTRRRITVSAKTKPEVVRRLRDKKLEIQRSGAAGVQRSTTVAKWAASWLEAIQPQVRPTAYETDKAAVRYIVAAIGAKKLADLTPADVRAVAAYIRRKGLSTSTALRYHGSLMRLVKAAALDGHSIAPNVLLAPSPKAAVHDRQAMSIEDAVKVLTHVATLPRGSRWALAFLQGIRQAEAMGLTWDAVDLDAGTLTICWQVKYLKYKVKGEVEAGFEMPDGYEARHIVGAAHLVRPKSRAGWRVIPLTPWAVNALRAWREIAPDELLVWPGRFRGGQWPRNPASDRDEWHEIQKAVKVAHPSGRPYTVHEIRHTTATLLMMLGVPESVRIAIMGHSSIAVTMGYEHVDVAPMRAALEQAGARLELGQASDPGQSST